MNILDDLRVLIYDCEDLKNVYNELSVYFNKLRESGMMKYELDALIIMAKEMIKREQNKRVSKLFAEGVDVQSISENFDISKNMVISILNKNKEDVSINEAIFNDKNNDAIIKLINDGKTIKEIAKEMNVSIGIISLKIRDIRSQYGINIINNKKNKCDEIDIKILELLLEGKTRMEVSEELNISYNTVIRRISSLKSNGYDMPNSKAIRKSELDNRIIVLILEGKTQTEIADELGLSFQTVANRIKIIKGQGREIGIIKYKKRNSKMDNYIVECIGKGKTKVEIAKDLNLSRQRIYQRICNMKKKGFVIPVKKELKDNNLIDNKIIKLLSEKRTIKNIAHEIGLSYETVSAIIKNMIEKGRYVPDLMNYGNEVIDELALRVLYEGKSMTTLSKEADILYHYVLRKTKK